MPTVVIPSKYDIIPIHNSDRAMFKNCRRRWDYSSPSRQNLTVRADIHGVVPALFFGTGIHYALEAYYTPTSDGVKRDPVEAFQTWFEIQWKGGIVTAEWLDRVYDLKPIPGYMIQDSFVASEKESQPNDSILPWVYRVRGLEDIIPSPDTLQFDEMRELGINMLKYYKDYAEVHDDFEVIAAEHDFSVPIWDYENDCILKARDLREQSPNYGNMLEVHSRGRMDIIKRNLANDKVGMVDHKTAARWGEEELYKLETDEQCTSYLYAAEVEANYYGLPWKDEQIEELLYNVLRKQAPKPPTVLNSGMFSMDRQNESTTYEILSDWIAKNLPGIPLNEKQQAYLDYLREVGDAQFIIRKQVRRNRNQIANAGKRLYLESLDMLDSNLRIYPNLRNDFACLNCGFRAPCLAQEDGSDYKDMIKQNYSVNRDR